MASKLLKLSGLALTTIVALSGCTFHSQPSNDQVFVSNEATGSVAIVDGATGRIEGQLATGPRPRGMAFSPDGKTFYVAASNANRIEAWDVASRKLSAPHTWHAAEVFLYVLGADGSARRAP